MSGELRFAARFDPDAFRDDMARTTQAGRDAAEAAKRDYEANGVPYSDLRPCNPEHRDGTKLPQCLKVYLPPPVGRFGMIFRFAVVDDNPLLEYLRLRRPPPSGSVERPHGLRHRPPASQRLIRAWPELRAGPRALSCLRNHEHSEPKGQIGWNPEWQPGGSEANPCPWL